MITSARHDGVIALFFGALEALDECGRNQLNFRGRHAVKVWTGGNIDDAHLKFFG
jgi:hypothetical protein